jgi:hypothetical protein
MKRLVAGAAVALVVALVAIRVPSGPLLVVRGDTRKVVNLRETPGACGYRHAANGQLLPDPYCTPGVVAARVTQGNIKRTICRSGYTDTVRPASMTALRTAMGYAYQIDVDPRVEFDHLVPLSLGGANDPRNLWPELPTSADQKTAVNGKDAVEASLRARVCAGKMTLADAQVRIATDWTTALA